MRGCIGLEFSNVSVSNERHEGQTARETLKDVHHETSFCRSFVEKKVLLTVRKQKCSPCKLGTRKMPPNLVIPTEKVANIRKRF